MLAVAYPMVPASELLLEIKMSVTTIELNISYNQIAVFLSDLHQPFNDWTEQHVAQGFAWRPGSVSFRTIVESGKHFIEVVTVKNFDSLGEDVLRAIEVPFEIPTDGKIDVASISDSISMKLPPGMYCLRCEFLGKKNADEKFIRIVFASNDTPHFSLLKADEDLSPKSNLLTTAAAA